MVTKKYDHSLEEKYIPDAACIELYRIFTYIYPANGPDVGKYSIHGAEMIIVKWKITVETC